MKIPQESIGKTFKCVRCGEHMKSSEDNAVPLASPPSEQPASQETTPAQNDAPPAQEPIGQMLINGGVITEEQLQDALAKQKTQGGKTFELLIALGYLDKDALHDFLSRQPGIAAIDLSRCNIGPELIALVPKKMAIESLVLPIDQLGKLLTVAMACPLDVATIASLEKLTGLRVKAMLCKLEDIHAAVQKYYPDRSRMDLSPSSFDNILGASEGPKEKVETKISAWDGVILPEDRLNHLRESVQAEKSTEKIARIVLLEPTLVYATMRVANSDVYGMTGQVESAPMAVAVLGKEGVCAILEEVLSPVSDTVAEPLASLKDQCCKTANIAQGLAIESGVVGEQTAYTLGMLGEMGRLALAAISPVKYKRVKSHLTGSELSEAEMRLFTMDHATAASTLAELWHYPVQYAKVLRHYGIPEDAEGAEAPAALVGLAIALAYADPENLEEALSDQSSAMSVLKIDPKTAARVLGNALQTGAGNS
jgi:HD-like signal output (HDOD) protein